MISTGDEVDAEMSADAVSGNPLHESSGVAVNSLSCKSKEVGSMR